MKILFINRFLDKNSLYREPIGLMVLSAALKPKHKVFVLESQYENLDKRVKEIRPDVIAYSINTGFHQYFLNLNKKLKKKNKFISLFGGNHATFYPEVIMQDGVDCICRGEADDALREFLDLLEKGGDITKVKNFWVKKEGKIFRNDMRPLIKNLDSLKFPDRELFDRFYIIRESKIKNIITSRGCPFDCSYCYQPAFKRLYGRKNFVRRRSVDNVIKEIIELKKKYDFEIIRFEDDTFNLNKEWLREFSSKFSKLNLKMMLSGIRADLMDKETGRILKKCRCICVIFGLESGNYKIRRKILNKDIKNSEIQNCAKILRKNNIEFLTENIIGIPGTDFEDDLETLKLNIKIKSNYALAHILQPFPATKIFSYLTENGFYKKESDFMNVPSFYETSCMKVKDKRKIDNLQKLFALTVSFPFLFPYLKMLCGFPLNYIYSFLFNFHKAVIGLKLYSFRRGIKEYFFLIKSYFL